MASQPARVQPRVPARAVVLSLLSLLAAIVGNVYLSQAAREYAMLPWLLALVPGFLLAYYKGWRGSAIALEVGMVALVGTEVFVAVTGTPFYDSPWFAVVLLIFIAVTLGLGGVTELLHRARVAAEMNSFEVVSVLDRNGVVLETSPSIERVLGYAPDEIVGRRVLDFVHPDDMARAAEVFGAAVDAREEMEAVDTRFRHADGSWRILESRGRSLFHDPDIGGLLVSSRDVTTQRELQAAVVRSQRMESIGRLTGGIAHDFNNVLTAISAHSSFLLDGTDPDDPNRAEVEAILSASRRARDLTRQLLAFSRQQVLNPRPVDLNEMVPEILKLLRRTIRENVLFDWPGDPSLNSVLADPTHLRQILINLVVNAAEAMPEGGTLSIRARNQTMGPDDDRGWAEALSRGDYVELTVTDTGVGIDPDDVDKVFEPFFTTKESGTGLGLATVYGIVKQSGGHITAAPADRGGTRFTLWLPAGRTQGTESEPDEAPAEDRIAEFGGTVLVVEDDTAVRGIAERILSRRGWAVVTAENADDALTVLRTSDVDLLLTDVIMPGISGIELARQAKELSPRLRVLLTSGYAATELDDDSAITEGAFLQKPFTPSELMDAVEECRSTTSS